MKTDRGFSNLRHPARRSPGAFAAGMLAWLLLTGIPAGAGVYQWNGNTSGAWEIPENWNPEGVPAGVTQGPAPVGGTFAHRLNVNNGSANPLLYTTAQGETHFGAPGIRGLVVGSGSSGAMRITGGRFTTTGSNLPDVVGSGSAGVLTIDGGAFAGGTLMLGLNNGSGSGTLNVLSGETTLAAIQFNYQSPGGSGVIHLNGGRLIVGELTESATGANGNHLLNFNGGTLVAGAPGLLLDDILTRANIRNGGAKFDTNGHHATIGQPLVHSNLPGDLAQDGGLVKTGIGILGLANPATYTGPTRVEQGGLDFPLPSASQSLAMMPGTSLELREIHAPWMLATASANNATLVLNYGGPGSYADAAIQTANLHLSGNTVLNVRSVNSHIATESLTLIRYGAKTGTGTLSLGDLSPGLAGSLIDTGTEIRLKLTSLPPEVLTTPAILEIHPYDHLHVYDTSGVGFGAYTEHLAAAVNQEEIFRWLYKDLELGMFGNAFSPRIEGLPGVPGNDNNDPSVTDWGRVVYPSDSSLGFWIHDKAKALNPDLRLCTNAFAIPYWLRGDGATEQDYINKPLDYANPNLYAEIAEWMIINLIKYKEDGVDVEMINIYNEPDVSSQFGKKGTEDVLANVIPLVRAWVASPANTYGVKMPKVGGPSNTSVLDSRVWLEDWKANRPDVWDNLDMVAIHQYFGAPFDPSNYARINSARGGRPFWQTEMHTGYYTVRNNPSVLPEDHVDDPLEAALTFGMLFSIAVNNGLSYYQYFWGVSPQYEMTSLILSPYGGVATRRKVYFAFKQFTSMQSPGSNVVETTLTGGHPGYHLVAYHKWGENRSIVTVANARNSIQDVTLKLTDPRGQPLPITSIREFDTSASNQCALLRDESFYPSVPDFTTTIANHCVRTFEIEWNGENELSAADDWESPVFMGGGTGWSGNWLRSGAPLPLEPVHNKNAAARLTGNASGSASIRRVLSTSLPGGFLRFKWDVDGLDAGESGNVEVFNGSWNTLKTFTSADNATDDSGVSDNLRQMVLSLDDFPGITQVRFSIQANSGDDFFHVDEVEVVRSAALPEAAIISPIDGATLTGVDNGLALHLATPQEDSPAITWTRISGPGSATFANPAAAETTVVFSSPGTHVLQASVATALGTNVQKIQVNILPGPDPAAALALNLDESSGTVAGNSATGSPGILTGGVTWDPSGGVLRGAARFNGSDAFISVPDHPSFDGTPAFTLAFRFRADTIVPNGGLVSKRVAFNNGNAFSTFLDSHGRLNVDLDSNNNRFTSISTFEPGPWYHVAVTFDGSQPVDGRAKLYIQGELDRTASETSAMIPDSIAPVVIGSLNAGSGAFFDGWIDDVRIYRRSLDAWEIAALAGGKFAPRVDAGPAPSASTGLAVPISGHAQSDITGPFTTRWWQSSGPSTAIFQDPANPITTVTFGQSGGHVLRLEATNPMATTFQDLPVPVAANPDSWPDWQSLEWPGSNDPLLVGPLADPDADGLANLLEWAMGLDPHLPGPLPTRLFKNGEAWSFEYTRPSGRIGVDYTVEVSDSLAPGSWTSQGVTHYRTAPGPVETWQADATPISGQNLFFRLRVRLP